jgi:DNA-binding transcriptional LysR family regulator
MRDAEIVSRQLKLRQLRILVETAQRGSMVKAGEHLGISQPVVSKAISDLEHALGVPLLDRLPQGVEPTLYGRALIKRSVAMFDDLRSSVSEIESLSDPLAGELRIGAYEGTSAGLLPVIIGRLGESHPRISFDVVLADPATLKDRDLRGRRVDLVISNVTAELLITEDEFETTVLQPSPQHLVCAKSSHWASRKTIAISELVSERWILPKTDHPVRIALTDTFRAEGLLAPAPVVTVGSPNITAALVLQFGYLGVVGDIVLRTSPLSAQLHRLPISLPLHNSLKVGIVTLRDRTLSPAAKLFIATARQVVADFWRN